MVSGPSGNPANQPYLPPSGGNSSADVSPEDRAKAKALKKAEQQNWAKDFYGKEMTRRADEEERYGPITVGFGDNSSPTFLGDGDLDVSG